MLGWGWRTGGEDRTVVGARRVVQRKITRGLGRYMVRIAAGLEVLLIRRGFKSRNELPEISARCFYIVAIDYLQ